MTWMEKVDCVELSMSLMLPLLRGCGVRSVISVTSVTEKTSVTGTGIIGVVSPLPLSSSSLVPTSRVRLLATSASSCSSPSSFSSRSKAWPSVGVWWWRSRRHVASDCGSLPTAPVSASISSQFTCGSKSAVTVVSRSFCGSSSLSSSSSFSSGVSSLLRAVTGHDSCRAKVTKHVVSPARTVPYHILRPSQAEYRFHQSTHETPITLNASDDQQTFKQHQQQKQQQQRRRERSDGETPSSSPMKTMTGDGIEIKTPAQIEAMRMAGRYAGLLRAFAGSLLKPGMTTDEIDARVHAKMIEHNVYPSPLHYVGFPKSICTSINEVCCHGIPDSRPLQNGDIISIDVSCFVGGVHGDCCGTFFVGDVDQKGRHLVAGARDALERAIKICGPDVLLEKIGFTISDYVESQRLAVVPQFTGHGIGAVFHMPPSIFHCRHMFGRNDKGVRMKPGMTFTIEPVVSEGGVVPVLWDDKWTVSTMDLSRTAQFEETILITETGIEILTRHSDITNF